jgi:SWI/SNF-related matrix-associated actin-dependent regulator of chromatin subfamily A3
MAKHLAAVMDSHPGVRIEGTIPRGGNSFNLPLLLEFYIADATEERARMEAINLSSKLRGDNSFRLTPEYGGSGDTAAAKASSSSKSITVVNVMTKKLDWGAQQAALDKMFDVALKEQYTNLPNITMPTCLSDNITLFDYQIKGVQWLVKRETEATPAPFYTKVNENGRSMYLCEITKSSQATPPTPIRGSILADEMGLGKSIQTVALILLAPPAGIVYDAPQAQITDADVPVKPSSLIPTVNKRCTLIVCPVSVLGNWTDQISTFVSPGVLKVELYHGTNRHAVLSEVNSGNVDVLLASYNTLAADYDGSSEAEEAVPKKKKNKRARMEAVSIFAIEFHRIVLDEAHMIRNSKTRSFKAVSLIKAERKLALTGTPLVNSSDDIFSLLSFLGVEPLNEKAIFSRSITQPIKNGDEIGLTRLRTTMGFLSLRRSKQNSGVKLVDKDVQLCSVDWMDDAHKRVYDALFGTVRCAMEAILGNVTDDSKALKNYSVIFEKLLRLRQGN